MAQTIMSKAVRIERETADWLKKNGYNPIVARINLNAQELQIERKKIQVGKELIKQTK